VKAAEEQKEKLLETRITASEFLIPHHMLIIAEYYPLTKYYCKK